jgi:hypothetical protein
MISIQYLKVTAMVLSTKLSSLREHELHYDSWLAGPTEQ